MGEHDVDGDLSLLEGRTELEVLIEQIEELLGEGVTTADDAVEVAGVAGLAARLGAPADALAPVRSWLQDVGQELVEKGLADIDLDELVETLDNLEGADDFEIEEAVSDFDDVVSAAWFAGLTPVVRPAARQVARLIRQVPDPFAFMSETGRQVARSRVVAEDLDLFDYWLAIAEAEEWA